MRRVFRRTSMLLGGLALFALIAGLSAQTALASSVTGSVSNRTPLQKHTVYVYARVLNNSSRPVSGAWVSFSFNLGTRTVVQSAKTSSKGVASVTRLVDTRAWQNVVVGLKVKVAGKYVTAKTSYFTLPIATPTNPVTVKIVAAQPLTAGATSLGQGMRRGVAIAIAQANESATVQALGIRFALVSSDDQGNPARAYANAKALMTDPQILGVSGHLNSGCSIPAAPVYGTHRVPMVTGISTNPYLTQMGLANVFRATYNDTFQGLSGANAAYSLGDRTAYVVDDSTPYGEGVLATAFSSHFASLGGTVLGNEHTTDSQSDFSAVVAVIKAAHPDVVYYGGIYNAGALFSSQLHSAGCTASVMGGDGLYDPTYISLGGSNGDYCTSVGYPAGHMPNSASFDASFTALYPGISQTDYDAYAFDATDVIIGGIVHQAQHGGTRMLGTWANRGGIISQIAATDLEGTTGRIRFGANHERRDPVCSLFQVVGGDWNWLGVY